MDGMISVRFLPGYCDLCSEPFYTDGHVFETINSVFETQTVMGGAETWNFYCEGCKPGCVRASPLNALTFTQHCSPSFDIILTLGHIHQKSMHQGTR